METKFLNAKKKTFKSSPVEMVHCERVKTATQKITFDTITSGIGRAGCSEPRDLTHEVRVVVERVYERLQNRLTLYFF